MHKRYVIALSIKLICLKSFRVEVQWTSKQMQLTDNCFQVSNVIGTNAFVVMHVSAQGWKNHIYNHRRNRLFKWRHHEIQTILITLNIAMFSWRILVMLNETIWRIDLHYNNMYEETCELFYVMSQRDATSLCNYFRFNNIKWI